MWSSTLESSASIRSTSAWLRSRRARRATWRTWARSSIRSAILGALLRVWIDGRDDRRSVPGLDPLAAHRVESAVGDRDRTRQPDPTAYLAAPYRIHRHPVHEPCGSERPEHGDEQVERDRDRRGAARRLQEHHRPGEHERDPDQPAEAPEPRPA